MRIERGPECKECQCSACSNLPKCHIISPTTEHYCVKECGGLVGVANCSFANEENEVKEESKCSVNSLKPK